MANSLPKDASMQTSILANQDTVIEDVDASIFSPRPESQVLLENNQITEEEKKESMVLEKNDNEDAKIQSLDNKEEDVKTQSFDNDIVDISFMKREENPVKEEIEKMHDTVLEDNKPFLSSNESAPKIIKSETNMLVPVSGNPKVLRCLKCHTFVSANKSHSEEECVSRSLKFNERKGRKKVCKNSKKGKVEEIVSKNYRVLEKNMEKFVVRAKKLNKKYKTNPKFRIPTELKNFIESFSKQK